MLTDGRESAKSGNQCSDVRRQTTDAMNPKVSTTCGSGWVV